MNRNGSSIFLVLMLAVIFFFLGLALAPAVTEVIGESMTGLGCSSATDSFIKGGCILMDLMGPLIIGIIFGMAGAVLGGIVTWG